MSKKISDFEVDEKRDIQEELEGIASSMGMDAWESWGSNSNKILKDMIGICHNCKRLNYCKTEFGNVYAFCNAFEIKLNGQNRMIECNLHAPKGTMTLNEMYAMAYLIEPGEEKIEGFISRNPKLKNG